MTALLFDDARRYVELARAGGWRDPEVDPMEMIASLVDAHAAEIELAEDAIRDELAAEHAEALADQRKEFEQEQAEALTIERLVDLALERVTAIELIRAIHIREVTKAGEIAAERATEQVMARWRTADEHARNAKERRKAARKPRKPKVGIVYPELGNADGAGGGDE